MLLVVKIYNKVPPGNQPLPELQEIQTNFLVQPSPHPARSPARLDNPLRAWPADLVVHLESQRGLGRRLRTAEKGRQDEAVFYRHARPGALPGRGGVRGVAQHDDGAGDVCAGWRMLP